MVLICFSSSSVDQAALVWTGEGLSVDGVLSKGSIQWDFMPCFPPCSNIQEGFRHSGDASKAGKQAEGLTSSETGLKH